MSYGVLNFHLNACESKPFRFISTVSGISFQYLKVSSFSSQCAQLVIIDAMMDTLDGRQAPIMPSMSAFKSGLRQGSPSASGRKQRPPASQHIAGVPK